MSQIDSGIQTSLKSMGFCGNGVGSMLCQVDVKDGKVLRIRPMHYDEKYTPEQMKAWSLTARGKTFSASMKAQISPYALGYKDRIYSKNRILYPMKREDWDPNGERNPQNRGKSKYVRISWEEALDIIESEIKRVIRDYGPYSILCQGDGHAETKAIHGGHGCMTMLMDLLGGYTYQARNPDSWEGWHWGAKHVWGQQPIGQANQNNNLVDISRNCDMMLLWGCDVNTTPYGWGGQKPSSLCFWFTELGMKQVYVCPDVNYGCAVHADKWIPIYPNTDTALQLAIMYTWLTEGLWDKKYVETHASDPESFFAYVLGEEDGVAKTPKWAEPLCGVPSRQIKALAHEWHEQRTSIGHGNGGSFIRGPYSHEPARMEIFAMTMQGLGKPGRQSMKFIEWQMFGLDSAQPMPRSEKVPSCQGCYHGWEFGQKDSFIPKTLIPQALAGDYTSENPLTWYSFPDASFPGDQQFIDYQYPLPGANPVHMIWSDSPCWSTCWNGGNRILESYRSPKLEFILTQHIWFENDCRYADLLLPVNTKFEEEDFGNIVMDGDFNLVFHEAQSIAPRGESMSDWEMVCEVAKRFGDKIYNQLTEGGMGVKDYVRRGFEQSGITEYISYEDFMDKKYFVVPTVEDWESDPCGFENFYKSPEEYPLDTVTGKVMFYSYDLEEFFPDDQERGPFPKWIPSGESHQESRVCDRAEDYPFLLVSNHPHWRVHAQFDDMRWLREIQTCKIEGPDGYLYEPVWINTGDAKALGIKQGDIVKIYNERGWVLGGAYVTERIQHGVVSQDHGARVDPIESGVSDRAGANNLIAPANTTSKNCVGEVTSGFLVGVEKIDVFALAEQYPEAFGRKFDASGVLPENWFKEVE